MPRNPQKRRCLHPGCRAWALRGGELCRSHSGRPVPAAGGHEAEQVLPSLQEEIRLLAARRDLVDEYLTALLDEGRCTAAEALRYLAVLSQASRTLARLLDQHQATAGDVAEVQRFLEEVEGRVRELAMRDP